MNYTVRYAKLALSDIEKLRNAGLLGKAKILIDIITINPYKIPPPYEKLNGKLNGYYSRRINKQHRIVYSVDEKAKLIIVSRMWTHYDKM